MKQYFFAFLAIFLALIPVSTTRNWANLIVENQLTLSEKSNDYYEIQDIFGNNNALKNAIKEEIKKSRGKL